MVIMVLSFNILLQCFLVKLPSKSNSSIQLKVNGFDLH